MGRQVECHTAGRCPLRDDVELVETQKENSLGCPSQLILWLLEKGCGHGCDLYMHLSMPCTLRSEGTEVRGQTYNPPHLIS